jgi:hypothetical protein
MEIHGPEGPTHSFKDFAIHIVIVTIGILIALGLEGVREMIYEHRTVREARENFQAEFHGNRLNLDKELINDKKTLAQLDQIIKDLPLLRQNPPQLAQRVAVLGPSGYFFSSSRWDSALSTGALGHMSVDEVNRYAQVNFMVHTYTSLESKASNDWEQLEAFFKARPSPGPAELDSGVEKIFIYHSDVRDLNQAGEEFSSSLDRSLEQD